MCRERDRRSAQHRLWDLREVTEPLQAGPPFPPPPNRNDHASVIQTQSCLEDSVISQISCAAHRVCTEKRPAHVTRPAALTIIYLECLHCALL